MAKELVNSDVAGLRVAAGTGVKVAPPIGDDGHAEVLPSSGSPGLESNPDSCYDSDDSSSVGSRCNGFQAMTSTAASSTAAAADVDEHSDVSRTTSDTLAAERSETDTPKCDVTSDDITGVTPAESTGDVTLPSKQQQQQQQQRHLKEEGRDDEEDDASSGGTRSPADDLMSNAEYAAKVEFGLRLGYSEDQILRTLDTIGYKVGEDRLLAELVRTADVTDDSDVSDDDSPADVSAKLDRVRLGDGDPDELRPIVIDGSNVAMSHGNNIVFSCAGIKLAVDWFRERGHKEITVFVPTWRKEASCPVTPITDQDILLDLEKKKIVVFTPARRIAGKRVICYDDRYVMKLAAENGGIVVSNDNYRDLVDENPDYKKVVEERLLMYSFVNDRFMPPDDPLGRHGPNLNDFLRKHPASSKNKPPNCPYGKKCTYGNKCKYNHPERGQQPVKLINERLIEKACKKIKEVKEKGRLGSGEKKTKRNVDKPAKKLPLTQTRSQAPAPQKKALTRTRSLQPNPLMVQGKPQPLPDLLQPKSGTGNKEGKDVPVQVSVTADSDNEDYERYNNKLSELCQKVKDAEASENRRWTSKESVPREEAEHKQDIVKEKTRLSSWAVQRKDLLPEFREEETSFTNGHLALAKKLSDEGKSCDNQRHVVAGMEKTAPDQSQPVRGHMTLQRQLSLKGSDDPRLLKGTSGYSEMFGARTEETRSCAAWPVQNDQPHWSRQGHNALGKRASCPLVTVAAQSRESSPRPGMPQECIPQQMRPQDQHTCVCSGNVICSGSRNTLSAQDLMPEHLSLHRLKSDPLVRQNDSRAFGHMMKFCEISRQNSSSDPQLSVHQEEQNWSHLPNNEPGNNTSDIFVDNRQNILGIPLHIRTAPNSPHVPMSPLLGQESFPFGHSASGIPLKDNHGPFSNVYNSTGLIQVPDCPVSNFQNVSSHLTTSFQAPNIRPSNVGSNVPLFLSGQSEAPSIMMPGLIQSLSKQAQIYNQLGYQPSLPRYVMSQVPPKMSPTAERQPIAATSVPVSLVVQDSPLAQNINVTSAESPVQKTPWMSGQGEPSGGQTNARYKLYYHLCALFKEEDVKRIMLEHPNETDPQMLCRYLLSR